MFAHHAVGDARQTEPPYLTIRKAAASLGLKYHALLRAVNAGDVPSYTPFNSRRLVRLSDIEAVIAAHRRGGGK